MITTLSYTNRLRRTVFAQGSGGQVQVALSGAIWYAVPQQRGLPDPGAVKPPACYHIPAGGGRLRRWRSQGRPRLAVLHRCGKGTPELSHTVAESIIVMI